MARPSHTIHVRLDRHQQRQLDAVTARVLGTIKSMSRERDQVHKLLRKALHRMSTKQRASPAARDVAKAAKMIERGQRARVRGLRASCGPRGRRRG